MSKSLFEQYQEAKEAWEVKQDEDRFDYLCEKIEDEDLNLKLINNNQYVITTNGGIPVSEQFDSLDKVEAWLDDPKFVFDLDDDSDDDEGLEVDMVNEFLEKFYQEKGGFRDLILRAMFKDDQLDRQNEYNNAELRKVSIKELYSLLNDAHQEQIRRYMILLLTDQENMIE